MAITGDGTDAYNFGERAILVREIKTELGLAAHDPLPAPRTVEIEPTLVCSARCHFCSYEADIEKFRAEIRGRPALRNGLPRDVVLAVLDALRDGGTTAGTFWSGGGEPLVWPHLLEAVARAATFSAVSIQTNGIGLGRFFQDPESLRSLRLLTVSLYADNPEMHTRIAGVASFEKVIANVREVIEWRRRLGLTLTVAGKILVDAINYRHVAAIVRFYRELGLDVVGLREVQDYNYGGEGKRAVSVALTLEQKRELHDDTLGAAAPDPSLRIFAQTVMNTVAKPEITEHCYNATDGHFACIDGRGNVFIGNPEIGDARYCIGNVLESPWSAIWRSDRHRAVIEAMDRAQRAGTCASDLCRHVRANVGVQRYLAGSTGPSDRDRLMRGLGAFL